MNVSEAALTREQLMLRELFRDHFELADRFEATANQMVAVDRSLHGSGEQQGIAELLLDAAENIRGAASSIDTMNLDGFSRTLDSLSRQIAGLPGRLLRPADEIDFRASLREGIAQVLADSIIDAKLQVEREAVEVAINDLAGRVKAAMAQLGESSANYFAERNQLRGQLDAEKVKSAAVMERLTYFEQDKDNALRQMTTNFAATAQRTGTARLIDLCAGLAIGIVVSLSVLVPMASQYLNQQIHAKQQR
ncbi:hypothetical protein [Pseudomonas fontis]|uniref:Methyl-accepting chemotaxis protein n=1 Tax=Pseudomonas fontis TaxID=2942633 RepID=A0ABT5NQV1_9PSED|nr:hypothetical protein [Pseudomonas fontis]MDD0972642.1 hypothetical protein [Pseudomonas fontis]MDD0990554.1 hypothetical protein [Pseudomonas fontis]